MKVLITDPIDAEGVRILRDRGLEVEEAIGLAGPELAARLAQVDALVVRSGTQVTADVLPATRLRAIGRAGVGVNNVDVDAATRRGIAVMNVPTGNIMSAVEHTLALLLSMARKIPQADRSMKDGKWTRAALEGVELYGKTLGIVGLGRIGSRVATRGRAFGMDVVAYDPFLSPKKAEETGVKQYTDVDEMLPLCDFVTVHVPLTDATKGLFDSARLARMKKGARIVNCSRGGVIDEPALAQALASGHLAGAALDVWEKEPPEADNPLVRRADVVATPHLGASTAEAQRKVGIAIAEQIADALTTGVFREAVNFPVEDWATYEKVRPWLLLAERLGSFGAQFVASGLEAVEVEFVGPDFEERKSIVTAVLKGLIEVIRGEPVNYVNAPFLAAERGLEVAERTLPAEGLYRQLLRVRLRAGARASAFSGTLFHGNSPRIVEIDQYEMEIIPEGVVLVFENEDRPGVIGAVGSVLGDARCNIARFILGRHHPGGMAMAALNLDSPIPQPALETLRRLTNLRWARQIVFAPALPPAPVRTGG